MSVVDDLIGKARSRPRLPEPAIRRLLRQRAGLTQAVCAESFHVERPTFCRWELGTRTPRGEHLVAYAQLLDRLAREVA